MIEEQATKAVKTIGDMFAQKLNRELAEKPKPLEETHPSVVEYGIKHDEGSGAFMPGLIADLAWHDFTELIQATTVDKQVILERLKEISENYMRYGSETDNLIAAIAKLRFLIIDLEEGKR